MKKIKRSQFLPINIEEAWSFFSNPGNLKKITPDYMGFRIKSEIPNKIFEGMIIKYKVKPILSIPLTWITEISLVKEPNSFIDTQKTGPYKSWSHKHIFKEVEGGIEMIDELSYEAPFGWLGRLMENLFIESQVEKIFNFRNSKLKQLFPE